MWTRWSEYSNQQWANRVGTLEADLRAARHDIAAKDSKIAILEAEIEFLTQWRTRELERLKAEASVHTARRLVASAPAINETD